MNQLFHTLSGRISSCRDILAKFIDRGTRARARIKGGQTGEALIAAMQSSPHREIEIEPVRAAMPVRRP